MKFFAIVFLAIVTFNAVNAVQKCFRVTNPEQPSTDAPTAAPQTDAPTAPPTAPPTRAQRPPLNLQRIIDFIKNLITNRRPTAAEETSFEDDFIQQLQNAGLTFNPANVRSLINAFSNAFSNLIAALTTNPTSANIIAAANNWKSATNSLVTALTGNLGGFIAITGPTSFSAIFNSLLSGINLFSQTPDRALQLFAPEKNNISQLVTNFFATLQSLNGST